MQKACSSSETVLPGEANCLLIKSLLSGTTWSFKLFQNEAQESQLDYFTYLEVPSGVAWQKHTGKKRLVPSFPGHSLHLNQLKLIRDTQE